jgi:DNA-binding HxlR family transcriptional regulator
MDRVSHSPRCHQLIELIGARWTLAILAQLAGGGRRYQDLHGGLNGISHKVLTDTLRRAERDGLVIRHLDAGRVETATLYKLSHLGRSVGEPLTVLDRWVERNWSEVESARHRWSRRAG